MTALADQSARDLIRTALDRTMVVEAAAGTGKTTELVNRIISILAAGLTKVDCIVAVTFTEKAAGELKLRLRERLEQERAASGSDEQRRARVEQALAHLEEARAGTIHSFCADLLRERPMQARIDPLFEQLDEASAEQLYGQVFRVWLQQQLENPPEGIRRSLRRTAISDTAADRLQRAGWALVTWRDFPAPWTRQPFDRTTEIDRLVDKLHEFAALTRKSARPDHPVFVCTWRARQVSDYIRESERTRPRDYDGLEAQFVSLSKTPDFYRLDAKGLRAYGPGITRDEVLGVHQSLAAEIKRFAQRADADLAALLHSELQASIAAYEEAKTRTGRLDFLDLLIRTRDLLRDDAAVRADLQQRFSHLFVDEFQDTDPTQAELLMLLTADDPAVSDWRQATPVSGKLFIVGDPKQAIYRFRRADVALYKQVKELLVTRGALKVDLTTSFRAVPSIQNLVNAAFAPQMTDDSATLQAAYVPLAPFRPEHPDQPSIVALSVPQPYGKKQISADAVLKSQPDAAGAFVDWLLKESGWTVSERGRDERVPIAARHVCIMFRRFEKYGEDMTRAYVSALEARGIAHLLVGGKSFHEREEVETLRTALSAIEWPDDELSVFAALHGSLLAVPDDALLEYRRQFGRLHPFRVPNDLPEALRPVGRGLELLQSLCRSRNHRPVAETINLLLTATRAHAGFALRPAGEQVLANVMRVAELARQYDAAGGTSFRGFVEQLITDAEQGRQAEAAIYEEGAEGVRLMSVHRAKGLEFPVVILADITAKIAHSEPDRYIDPERGLCAVKIAGWAPHELLDHAPEEHAIDCAEGVRVAYVAATRARDLLVIPAIGDDPTSGRGPDKAADWWVTPLYRGIYPPEERRRRPSPAKQCPKFGSDSVLTRPDNGFADETNVRPGAHGFGRGDAAYAAVWWDPRALELGKAPSFSIRQQELLEKGSAEVVERDLRAYTNWRTQHDGTVERGANPTLRVQTATERARAPMEVAAEVTVIDAGRPVPTSAKGGQMWGTHGTGVSGARFGRLVHAVLATVPLDCDAPTLQSTVQLQARILGATAEESEAAAAKVTAALQHPLMQRARAAGACYREVPLTLRDADGSLIEGIADLVFRENGNWIVVDFKTDQELTGALEHYCRQITIYSRAVAAATGGSSQAFLLRV